MNSIKDIFLRNKSTQQTVIKNTSWLFAAEISSRAIRFLLIIFAARMIGASGLGLFSYTMALGGIFMFLEDAGIGTYITRALIQTPDEKDRLIATGSILKLTLLCVAIILFITIGPRISSLPDAATLIFPMALVLVFDSLREFTFTISRAQERMEVESIIKFLTAFLMFLSGALLLVFHATALALTWGYALGGGLGFCIAFLYTKKYFKNPFQYFSKELIFSIFAAAWPFTVLAISNIVIFSTDIFFLGHFTNAAIVGSYTAAQRLIQITYVIPSLIISAVFPVFAKKVSTEHNYRGALEKIFALLIFLVLPLFVGISMWSEGLLHVVFGAGYINATSTLIVLSFGLIPIFITAGYSAIIFAENKQRQFVFANCIAMGINIILDFVLIPSFGALGAALAGVLSLYILAGITGIRFISLSRFTMFKYLQPLHLIAALAAMALSSVLFQKIHLPTLIGLPISALVYAAIVFITHQQQLRDTNIIAELSRRNNTDK